MDAVIESKFPEIKKTGYKLTSPRDYRYNCIAWAAGITDRWWEPNDQFFWPTGVKKEYSLNAYIEAYQSIGFEVCDNSSYEEGFEKIVLFIDNVGIPSHAARQIDKEWWTSKLGPYKDIQHKLEGLNGVEYGFPAAFLKRKK